MKLYPSTIKSKASVILLISLVVIQPILDTYYLYTDKVINLFGVSPATIIRLCLTLLLIGLTFIASKNKSKYTLAFGYLSIVIIYFLIHNFLCVNFTSNIPNSIMYSTKQELFYLIQLIVPQLVIFITFTIGISDKLFEKTIKILIFIICGSIVLGDIFKISLGSYTNKVITGNMIEWLIGGFGNLSFSDFASKGFFYFANRASVALIMLLPLNFYYFIKSSRISRYILLSIHLLALLMIGTKVATIGGILVLCVMLLICIFISFFNKKDKMGYKNVILVVVFIIIYGVILPKTPAIYREQIARNIQKSYEQQGITKDNLNKNEMKKYEVNLKDNNTKEESYVQEEAKVNNELSNETDKDIKIKYLKDNYISLKLNERYMTESYSYKEDPDFWINISKEPIENRLNQRFLQTKMIERVKEINNRNMDNWFGIGKTRIESIYNIEKDFVLQYYSLGIIGLCIFIMPFLIIVLLCSVVCIIKFKLFFNVKNISLISGVFLALICSWYNGNSIDSMFISIIIAFIEGTLLRSMIDCKKQVSVK